MCSPPLSRARARKHLGTRERTASERASSVTHSQLPAGSAPRHKKGKSSTVPEWHASTTAVSFAPAARAGSTSNASISSSMIWFLPPLWSTGMSVESYL